MKAVLLFCCLRGDGLGEEAGFEFGEECLGDGFGDKVGTGEAVKGSDGVENDGGFEPDADGTADACSARDKGEGVTDGGVKLIEGLLPSHRLDADGERGRVKDGMDLIADAIEELLDGGGAKMGNHGDLNAGFNQRTKELLNCREGGEGILLEECGIGGGKATLNMGDINFGRENVRKCGRGRLAIKVAEKTVWGIVGDAVFFQT